jgi:hypothetical protein
MQDSKFWRSAAVLMIAAVLYVGHGLHNGGTEEMPSLVNSAHAGGVAVKEGITSFSRIYTTDESGTHLYVWNEQPGVGALPKHIATIEVNPREVKAPNRETLPTLDEPFAPRSRPKP